MKNLNLHEMEIIEGGGWGSCGAAAAGTYVWAISSGFAYIPIIGGWGTLIAMGAACALSY